MQSRSFFPVLSFLAALTFWNGAVSAAPAVAPQDPKSAAWSVNAPPGTVRTAHLDIRSGTWMSVDVSPNGRHLVFDLLGDLYLMPIEGGEAKALTHSVAWEMQPRFSPDGQRIAFVSDAGGGDNIWVMNSDGSEARALTTEDFRLLNNPVWHPDGQAILARKHFTGTRSAGSGEIWLYHLAGGKGLQLNEKPNWQKDLGEPAISPDGQTLYYSQDATPGRSFEYNRDSHRELFRIMRQSLTDGRSEPLVTGPGGAIRPTPSPDGQYLAFVRRVRSDAGRQESLLFLKDLRSGREWPAWGPLERDLQESWSVHGVYPGMAWLPGGKELVVWARGNLWRVNPFDQKAQVIPFHIKDTRELREPLRVTQAVAPPQFDVKQLRWVQTAPDGSRVIYSALGHLYVRDLPDGAVRRLTSQNEHFELFPSFSQDGQSIVYSTWNDEKLGHVRLRHLPTGRESILTPEAGKYLHPRLSPDGRRVIYQKARGGYLTTPWQGLGDGLFLAAVDGKTPLQRLSRDGHSPQWAPGGDAVLFTRDVVLSEVDSEHRLIRLDLATREELVLARSEFASEFAVSPDGRWLGFTERFQTYVTPFPGTGKTLTLGPKVDALPLRRLSQHAGESLHWSGDSASLHYTLGDRLFRVPLVQAFSEGFTPPPTGTPIGFKQPSDVPPGRVAFVGARLITLKGDEVIEDGVLVTEGARILAVGPRSAVTIPADAFTVEAKGKTLIPGLIDLHWHGAMAESHFIPQQSWVNYATLAFGVTTLHDPSNHTSSILTHSEMQRAGQVVGPRIFSTGTILYGAKADVTAVVNNLDDALGHLHRLQAAGAISVKSYSQPRRDQRQQILEAARQTNMMVVPEGASLFQLNMNQVVDGHTTVEHALPVAEVYEDVRQLWSQTPVGYTPTLNVAYGGLDGEHYWYARTEVWNHPILKRFVPRSILEPRSVRRITAPEQDFNVLRVAQTATALQRAGVKVSIGAHGQREGLGAHWEMWMLALGGMTPLEALRAATLNPAQVLGLDRDLGSLEVGKLADVVVLDGDVLADIRQSDRIHQVMVGGRLYAHPDLSEIGPAVRSKPRKPFFFERGVGQQGLTPIDEHALDALLGVGHLCRH
ncbi:amidohydrolase family protein [Inhella gelatinilytica]|uniref:PD40 domain-containing protein n=1 Tax=Inhella gelatinilytica TaxID=2795030 RepID=A0A931NDS8_9BURK|nr:amidohydrolase family protein [Inhella gelatinilytica]MBH9552949.1 PD40 domain-containing protein [Inhella gelatinilytica]